MDSILLTLRALAALTPFLLIPYGLFAQEAESQLQPPSITVTGEAVIAAEPDQAEIDFGVVTEAKTAMEAASENAAKLSKVIASVKKLLSKEDEIKTVSYSLDPVHRRTREGREAGIVGYVASNILRVKIGALQGVGKLIDTATQSGANNVRRLVFTLRDQQGAQQRALRQAAAKAKSKAEGVADALGLRIVKIRSVAETDRWIRPVMPRVMAAQVEAAETPIETGTVEIRSSVVLTVEISER